MGLASKTGSGFIISQSFFLDLCFIFSDCCSFAVRLRRRRVPTGKKFSFLVFLTIVPAILFNTFCTDVKRKRLIRFYFFTRVFLVRTSDI